MNDTDRDTISRARAVLAEDRPSMYELGDMAARIGALEWHLDAALRLAERLAAAHPTEADDG